MPILELTETERFAKPFPSRTEPKPSVDSYIPNSEISTTSLSSLSNFISRQRHALGVTIKSNPTSRQFVELADLQLLRGKPELAIKYYKDAIRLNPDFIIAYRKIIPLLLNIAAIDEA